MRSLTRSCITGRSTMCLRFALLFLSTAVTPSFAKSRVRSRRYAPMWFREYPFICMDPSILEERLSITRRTRGDQGASDRSVFHQSIPTQVNQPDKETWGGMRYEDLVLGNGTLRLIVTFRFVRLSSCSSGLRCLTS